MCLIIQREQGQKLSKEFLENVRERNPDGWGILYHNRAGQARVAKGLSMSAFWEKYNRFKSYDAECIIHFRYATKGVVDKNNAHPYKVLGGERPIYLMHNGTIDIDGADKKSKLSDTRIFIRDVLRPMLEHIKNPHEFIRSKHFEFMMDSVAGDHSSRFVLFDEEGALFYGGWFQTTKGVWVSNTYAYDIDNPKTKYTKRSTSSGAWHNGSFSPSYSYDDTKSVESSRSFEDEVYADWKADVGDTDDFLEIADTYWNLTGEEIAFAMEQFYFGLWYFETNHDLPQHSVVRDFDGNTITPDDIEIAYDIHARNVATNNKANKNQAA